VCKPVQVVVLAKRDATGIEGTGMCKVWPSTHCQSVLAARVETKAVESVHKTSDSDCSIFKSPAPTPIPTPNPTPTPSQKLSIYYMIMVYLLRREKVS
jgi:hypothetical protein